MGSRNANPAWQQSLVIKGHLGVAATKSGALEVKTRVPDPCTSFSLRDMGALELNRGRNLAPVFQGLWRGFQLALRCMFN